MATNRIGIAIGGRYRGNDEYVLGAIGVAREAGLDVVVSRNWDVFGRGEVDGALIQVHAFQTDNYHLLSRVEQRGMPIVTLDSLHESHSGVVSDNRQAMFDAVGHLKELGHRQIAYCRGPEGFFAADDRCEAFMEAMSARDLVFDRGLLIASDWGFQQARIEFGKLLGRRRDFSSIVCCNDLSAFGCLSAAKQSGLRVPKDLALIGFDDFQSEMFADHPLSTFQHAAYRVGAMAMRQLLKELRDPGEPWRHLRSHSQFVARQSTLGEAYRAPAMRTKDFASDRVVEYLLELDEHLSEEYRENLTSRLLSDGDEGTIARRFLEVMGEAAENGALAFLYHNVSTVVGRRLRLWSESVRPPTRAELLGELQSMTQQDILFYSRYYDLLKDRIATFHRSFIANPALKPDSDYVFNSLLRIMQYCGARFLTVGLFDEPCAKIREFAGKIALWECDEAGKIEHRVVSSREDGAWMSEVIPKLDCQSSAYAMALGIEGTYEGVVFIDFDTEYGLFYEDFRPLLTARAQRARSVQELLCHMSRLESRTDELKKQRELLRQQRDELQRAYELMERASRAKSEFLALISHELRTPLNGILGMVDVLLCSELDEAQRGNVFIMRKSSQLLLSMINRILTYSDIESGQQSLAKTNFALKDLIERLSESCAEEARGAGLDFVSERSGTLPEQVQGDEVKLNEALANLLGNAVKFTPEGRVGFAVEGSVEESRATVRFKVSDTGVGIAKAERDRIFRAFEQGDASLTRQFEGVGLGLAISSRLIEMMGSKLEMKSEKGEGSSFWFSVTFELPR